MCACCPKACAHVVFSCFFFTWLAPLMHAATRPQSGQRMAKASTILVASALSHQHTCTLDLARLPAHDTSSPLASRLTLLLCVTRDRWHAACMRRLANERGHPTLLAFDNSNTQKARRYCMVMKGIRGCVVMAWRRASTAHRLRSAHGPCTHNTHIPLRSGWMMEIVFHFFSFGFNIA